MSIFKRLYGRGLGPEDYFTEIVAHLLRETDGLLFEWIDHLALVDVENYVDFVISTQVIEEEGRPDILIELLTEEGEDLIYIESKLDSYEGKDQLKRYAGELVKKTHAGKRFLLFITRDYEPKDETAVLKGLPPGSVAFRQIRWSDFYRFLKPRREDDRLIDEVCSFMEEGRMSQSNQYSPTDILTMTNLPHVLGLMDETLFGEVSSRFEEVVGNVSTRRAILRQFQHRRYVLVGGMISNGYLQCGAGFWFDEGDYPEVGLLIDMSPNVADKDPVMKMLWDLQREQNWLGYRLNQPENWPGVYKSKALNEIIMIDDHVRAIKDYLLELLEEVAEIKKRYADVPWNDGE